jgi:TolA-binding protein
VTERPVAAIDPQPERAQDETAAASVESVEVAASEEDEAPREPAQRAAARPSAPPEEELILEARRALDRDPTLAASRLALHARLYPRGVMSEERDALRVEILARRGDRERAREALERLRARYPGSAHIARLERIVAD